MSRSSATLHRLSFLGCLTLGCLALAAGPLVGPAGAQQSQPQQSQPQQSQSPPSAITLFPRQAEITEVTGSAGLSRLPLPPSVLETARDDLGDVRVHDANGDEIPYAILRGDELPRAVPRAGVPRVVVPSDAQTRSRGLFVSETYRIPIDHAPAFDGTYELLVEPDAPVFVRDVFVRVEPATGAPRELERGSVFRFAGGTNERLGVLLPDVIDGSVVVTLSGEGSRLLPRFSIREVNGVAPPLPLVEVPLTIQGTRREGTRTIVTLDRPRGFPIARLVVNASTPSFARPAEVRSLPSGRVVAQGGLVRIGTEDVRASRTITFPTLSPADPSERSVELVIEDGDSPALADLEVHAELLAPSLVFDAGTGRTLRWGGHRARAPRYDLMSQPLVSLERRALTLASLGPVGENPDYDERPALGFAMRPGQIVDQARYPFRAPLTVPRSADGLYEVTIPPAIAAEAQPTLDDLRVVDAEGRQWPYVLVEPPGTVELTAHVASVGRCADRLQCSRYEVALPVRQLAPTTLRIELAPRLLSRSLVAYGTTERGDTERLGETFVTSDGADPVRVELSLYGQRVTALWFESVDGEETPLDVSDVTLVAPSRAIRLVAPEGELALVVGDLDAASPRYDLARASALLAMLRPEPATLGELQRNPAFRTPGFFDAFDLSTIVLTALLFLVVVLLLFLTLRVARTPMKAPEEPAPSEPAPSEPAPSEPAPSEPAPSEPAPSELAPSEDGEKRDGA